MTVTDRSRAGILGTRERRVEGHEKVTGTARYAADVEREGMLWAAFTTSPSAHARIVSIDTSAAARMEGVRAVLTGDMVGERYFGRALCDWPVLALGRVLFIGQYVAAVAAETRAQAEAAARAVDVLYEDLPPLLDATAATAEDAPILHPHAERYAFLPGKRPPTNHPNEQGVVSLTKGDVSAAFTADVLVSRNDFTTPRFIGGAIEPHATVVWIDGETLHVHSTNKSPYALRAQLAQVAGIPPESIVVEQTRIGGDFGAKGLSVDEFPCYFLAKQTGKPVKHVRSYLEEIQSTNTRHASSISVKTAVTRDGKLAGLDVDVVFDGGAFAAGKPTPYMVPGTPPKIPYDIPNMRCVIRAVYSNTVPAGHVRAPADVQIMFALESHMDMVAAELNMDPLEFRRLNAVQDGVVDSDGVPYLEPRAVEVLDAVVQHGRWNDALPPGRARGLALCARHIGVGRAGIVLSLREAGTIELQTSVLDVGTGTATALQRMTAEALGIDPSRVSIAERSTAAAPMDGGPGASRVTNITGNALMNAIDQTRAALSAAGWDGRAETWEHAVMALLGGAPTWDVTGTFDGFPKPGTPEYHNFSAFMADVSVDVETGRVTVNEVLYVADVGTIVNPVSHAGQIEGGFVFGLGHALMEELPIEDGKLAALSLADYKLPSQRDVPPLRVVLLEEALGPGPFHSKAVGEISTAGVPPAIANAVARACGARIRMLPVTAERVYDALRELG